MKLSEIKREWYVVDAADQVVGRLASKIAMTLMGKNRPDYTPHIDGGNFVVVLNAGKIKLTGNKLDDKMYYSHTGYAGGIKEINAKDLLEKKPEEVIIKAVKGMLPKNKLAANMMKRLKVYAADEHSHDAQQPKAL